MMALFRPDLSWPDDRLIESCLQGDQRAWEVFVEKYRKLVYAIIRQYCTDQDDASDLFQGVWLDVYNDLGKLRTVEAVRGWLAQLTRHKCFHWKQRYRTRDKHELRPEDDQALEAIADRSESFTEEGLGAERDQQVREAIQRLSSRCREMVELLFFTQPPLPYKEVAERLGLATGSIGFIRGRCLQKLQSALEALGLS